MLFLFSVYARTFMCASYIVILAIFLLPDPHGNPPFSISRDYILDLHLLYLLGLFSVIFSFASDGLGHRRFIPRLELPPQSPPLRRKFLSRSARTINSISRPAYPRRTQPLYPLSVRPRKMPPRPRGLNAGVADAARMSIPADYIRMASHLR